MHVFGLILICILPLVSALPYPGSAPGVAIEESQQTQQTFLDQITTYLTAAFNLIHVEPAKAKTLVRQLEAPPISNLVIELNIDLQQAGLEPPDQNITSLPELAKASGQLKIGDIGGYLEYIAGRLGGATLIPNNVTKITLEQAAAGITTNPMRLKRSHLPI